MSLPLFLAGPILRRVTPQEVCLWAITSRPLEGQVCLYHEDNLLTQIELAEHEPYALGEHCFLVLITLSDSTPFPTDQVLVYDFLNNSVSSLSRLDEFLYPKEVRPQFIIPSHAKRIAHGSCRHPHNPSEDALGALDRKYAKIPIEERADLLMMTGDQIYADDVSGPMLYAIHQMIQSLGMFNQEFEKAPFSDSSSLDPSITPFYSRGAILPRSSVNQSRLKKWLKAAPEPIFSSHTIDNHLIGFSEFICMYLLVWSPSLWQDIHIPIELPSERSTELNAKKWQKERMHLMAFIKTIPNIRRLLAHIPTYMILDDHDITDDFNLTVGWERAVFNAPFAQQIITNAMLGYFCCQAWGNDPSAFSPSFLEKVKQFTQAQTPAHSKALNTLFHHFESWHYSIPTQPIIVVIDTRTRRWRSESNENKPSGLMDWESLMDFQNAIFNKDAVVVVSPAPMFGMKFIETLQRIVTAFGQPLLTDSENWMAHPGSANALLNIFKHPKTPKNFVILSGDVHYSFAYDIRLRFRKGSPKIWQITCSGFRNTFPEPLLSLFEWCDRKLFWPGSPLHLFTRRKRMKILRRNTDNHSQQLCVNQSAVGEVILNDDGSPCYIGLLTGKGEQLCFIENEPEAENENEQQDEMHSGLKNSD